MIATVLAVLGSPVAALTWSVGTAELLPPEPLPLGGYTARGDRLAESGGQPLIARCVILRQGDLRVAMVTCEMLTIPESLAREVAKQLPSDVRLWLNATHTHCAPDSQMLNDRMTLKVPGIASFQRKWLDWYAARIAALVKVTLARTDGLPADASTVSIASVPEGNAGRRRLAQPDPRVTRLTFRNGGLWLTSYAAHATLHDEKEMQTHGDWPGQVLRRIPGLVVPSAIGDVSPRSVGADADQQSANLAAWLLDADRPGIRWTDSLPQVRWAMTPIRLDKPIPHPTFAKANKVTPGLAQLAVNQFAPKTAQVSGIRVGSVAILGIPGEPTAEVGRRILALGQNLGFRWVVVASHVNSWIGYILMPEDYDRGGYEATLSFHGRETANRVIDAAGNCLLQLSGQNASR